MSFPAGYSEEELNALEKEVKGNLGFFNRVTILRLIYCIRRLQLELKAAKGETWW